jgi:hypothetical protein
MCLQAFEALVCCPCCTPTNSYVQLALVLQTVAPGDTNALISLEIL